MAIRSVIRQVGHNLTAWNTRGEGVHSPYLFSLVRFVLRGDESFYVWYRLRPNRQEKVIFRLLNQLHQEGIERVMVRDERLCEVVKAVSKDIKVTVEDPVCGIEGEERRTEKTKCGIEGEESRTEKTKCGIIGAESRVEEGNMLQNISKGTCVYVYMKNPAKNVAIVDGEAELPDGWTSVFDYGAMKMVFFDKQYLRRSYKIAL